MTQQEKIDKRILYVFLSVPFLASLMSMIHLINMVALGNNMPMAITLAITFELGSIVSFVALSKNILKRLKKELLMLIFVMLFILQAFGNVYSTFDYIRLKLLVDPKWLDSFREMFFNVMDVTTTKLTLAILIGLTIPIISLVLLKLAIDYFSVEGISVASAPESPVTEPVKPDLSQFKASGISTIEYDHGNIPNTEKDNSGQFSIIENAARTQTAAHTAPEPQTVRKPEPVTEAPPDVAATPEPAIQPEPPIAPIAEPNPEKKS